MNLSRLLLHCALIKIAILVSASAQTPQICRNTYKKNKAANVLVIYTGGTIGMVPHNETHPFFVNRRNAFVEGIQKVPELNDKSYGTVGRRSKTTEGVTMALPVAAAISHRIVYTIVEWETILDSTNMHSGVWMDVGGNIKDNYEKYDAFVVLHGTDTLAYTASMLSFMIENLAKTVVVTGSQVPMFQPNSDGLSNFLGALKVAGTVTIPEVVVFFDQKLFRGNRVLKINSLNFDAFASPNFPPLNVLRDRKFDIEKFPSCKTKNINKEKLAVSTKLKDNVALVKLYPTMSVEVLRETLKAPIEGVVIESFGAGNMPKARTDLMDVIKEANDRGVIIINISQCLKGGVVQIYETGELGAYGVISGYDMTPIAAFTKLVFVLSQDWDMAQKKTAMQTNLRGEFTVKDHSTYRTYELIQQTVTVAPDLLQNLTNFG